MRWHLREEVGRAVLTILATVAAVVFTGTAARAQFSVEVLHSFDRPPALPEGSVIVGSDGDLYGTASTGGRHDKGVIFTMAKDGTGLTVLFEFDGPMGAAPLEVMEGSDGWLYGATDEGGGPWGRGTLFKIRKDGTGFASLYSFIASNNPHPTRLCEGSDGVLYGTTHVGGGQSSGTLFRIQKDGTGFNTLFVFGGSSGELPNELIEGSDGALYGTTAFGGAHGWGSVFRIAKDGSGFTTLHSFAGSDGAGPFGGVMEGSDGTLYGTTGSLINGFPGGTVYRIERSGSGFSTLVDFRQLDFTGNSGSSPHAAVVEGADGNLYATTNGGGVSSWLGTIFRVAKDGSGFAKILDFDGANGQYPSTRLSEEQGVLFGTSATGGAGNRGVVFRIGTNGTGYAKLLEATNAEGALPSTPVESSDGMLYGTTAEGGTHGWGTVFRMNTDGSGFESVYSFTGGNSATPRGLVEASDTAFYGTSAGTGDWSSCGSVFKISKDSAFTTVHSFTGDDGRHPNAGMIEASDGYLYGTTRDGGASGGGSLFRVGKTGSGFANLLVWSSAYPRAGMTEGADSVLYGTTGDGGAYGYGSVFKVNRDGTGDATLFSFYPAVGTWPAGKVIEGSDGALYGVTSAYPYAGSVFKISKDGSGFTKLRDFDDAAAGPYGLTEAFGGLLYGTTGRGPGSGSGATWDPGDGTVFRMAKDGTEFEVVSIFHGVNGSQPAGLLLASNSTFYGATSSGGLGGGVIFRLLPSATADLAPAQLSFGEQKVGTPSEARSIAVTNNADPVLHVSAAAIGGAAAADFIVTADTCSGASLSRGESCMIELRFHPTVAGLRSATVHIDDDAWNAPQAVPLTGSGTLPGVALNPTSLTYGEQYVDTASAAQAVTLSNTGAAALAVGAIASSPGFTQANNCGVSLARDASCTIDVRFAPANAGPQSGILSIADDAAGSPHVVALNGSGIQLRIQLSKPSWVVSEAARFVTLTVNRPDGAAHGATVDYATSDGSATAGADYAATTGRLSFAAGVGSRPLTITLLPDTTYEGSESFLVALSNPQGVGARLGSQVTTVVTITDNDAVPTLQFGAPAYTATEGGPAAKITVVRSGVTTVPVTVGYATVEGSAKAPDDYTGASGTLSFGPGVVSQTFSVALADDVAPEPAESLSVVLSSPGGGAILGARSKATLTIKDNDQAVQFSAPNYAVSEAAGKATVIVKRTGGAAGTLTVEYTTGDGTAIAPDDYAATSGQLVFSPGIVARTFTVPIVNDGQDEGSETVRLTLQSPNPPTALGALPSAILTILDNEPVVQFSAATYAVAEPAAAGTSKAVVTVKRMGGTAGTVHVDYATSPGTALPSVDYAETAGQLTFGPGVASKSFAVPVLGNTLDELKPTVNLSLSPVDIPLGTPSTAVLTIKDNDVAGKAQLAAPAFSGRAAEGWAVITVTRSGGTAGPASVEYMTSDGSAVAGTDYTTTTGRVTFGPGETSHWFVVPIVSTSRPSRYFVVRLGETTGGLALGSTIQARVWIVG